MLDPKNALPLYQQLADRLRQQILNGVLPNGSRLETEPQLAADLQVARGTVRQALDLLVGEGLITRIRGKGSFVHTVPSQSINSRRIGLVIPYTDDCLVRGILSGMETVLRNQNYSLSYRPSRYNQAMQMELVQELVQEQISGLVLMPLALPDEARQLASIVPPDLRFIVIDRLIAGFETGAVMVDNHQGAFDATTHLIHMGYRRIAFLGDGLRISSVLEREDGYQDAMWHNGLDPLASFHIPWDLAHWDGHPPTFSAEQLKPILRFIESGTEPCALVCNNDFFAIGVMNGLLARGIRIPQDVGLVGFDDIPMASYLPVPLTTVKQPCLNIGVVAAETILGLIQKPDQKTEQIRLPVTLIARASSALA